MDDLGEQIALLESSANLSVSIADVQKAMDLVATARATIAAGMSRLPRSPWPCHCVPMLTAALQIPQRRP